MGCLGEQSGRERDGSGCFGKEQACDNRRMNG